MASPTIPIDTPAIVSQFRALAAEWKRGTELISSASVVAAHPAYQAIIELGWPVVPLLLCELEREPAPWFEALVAITGENPVSEQSWGQMSEMAATWVRWGRQRGLI